MVASSGTVAFIVGIYEELIYSIKKIDQVFIVSVVPKFLVIAEKVLRRLFSGKDIFVVGRDIKVPLVNKYQRPSAVGQDRLVTAYAAVSDEYRKALMEQFHFDKNIY